MGRAVDLLFISSSSLILFALLANHRSGTVLAQNATLPVDVGVILNLASTWGRSSRTSISMAVGDFYAAHGDYNTRLVLHFRNSEGDVVRAAGGAVDLLKNVQVKSILGPPTSDEAKFVIDLGDKTQVPVLSFAATSPSLSAALTPYFVRTTLDDSSQVGAIAAIMRYFGWREAVSIYEDSEYGRGVIPYLVDALQAIDAQVPYRSVIPTFATDDQIDEELYKLMTMQTRVFIVHMLPELGSRLFQRANEVGALGQGYAWIMTDGITDMLQQLDPMVIDAMEGVIGVRPYVRTTPKISKFSARLRARFDQDYPGIKLGGPSVFQLWAYDTVWAVAMAVEKVKPRGPSTHVPQSSADNSTDLDQLGVARTGPQLLDAIRMTRFNGLTGEFKLVDGQLQSSVFQIVNVIGKRWRSIGFWTPEVGLLKKLNPSFANEVGLKSIIWPEDSTEVPKGWEIPTTGKKLRVGVPVKHEFNQFVNIDHDPITNRSEFTGFCIDVFEAVLEILPYAVAHEYIPFGKSADSYDNLIYQVYLKNFDAVVGDTTIIANRSQFVDFTFPYTDSGVSMLVSLGDNSSKNAWVFLKPLTVGLWFGSFGFFIFTGFVVWVIEHRDNDEFIGTIWEQIGTIFYFTFSILVFSHKEKLMSNLTRFLVIIWVFVVLILTSSYTASLTTMLTVQQLQPKVSQLDELLRSGAYVGYQQGSFVKGLLERMNFPENKLRGYTIVQYAEALSNGSANGGVDAIFDEIPYLKIFLAEHCNGFTMVGPTYNTDGFGFVFPLGSPLAPDVSRAILNVTEGEKMTLIENKWFGTTNCTSQNNSLSSSSLDFESFKGLFLVTGIVSTVALLIFLVRFIYMEWNQLKATASMEKSVSRKIVNLYRYYHDTRPSGDPNSRRTNNRIHDGEEFNRKEESVNPAMLHTSASAESLASLYNHSELTIASPMQGLSSTEPNSLAPGELMQGLSSTELNSLAPGELQMNNSIHLQEDD